MSNSQPSVISVIIDIYGLALEDNQADAILATWFQTYDQSWILKALIESLYRGRYKLVSVDNILKDWQRIGKPLYNFTPEYERAILQKIPNLSESTADDTISVATSVGLVSSDFAVSEVESETAPFCYLPQTVDRSVAITSQNLNPEESAPFLCHYDSVAVAQMLDLQAAKPIDPAETVNQRNLIANNYYASQNLPAASGIVHQHPERQHRQQQQPVRPAKRRLFNTLKAIVDPRNHYEVISEEPLVLSPQFLRHHEISQVYQC